ncbi:hypothetical protein LOAG_03328 [Loa loa]|uniref:SAE2 domain-containing protein n=1 Tax=Loa loa TaxID=7209 RepID=A0A1I7VP22_LOALO|nr:hypothetical protein LOAG_03328 [Loa loa]EFO25155.1 hypothetical protein LOAG_03328 [Loa loa]
MNSYLHSSIAETTLSSSVGSVNETENSHSLNSTSFLDTTVSPIRFVEDHEKPQKNFEISLDALVDQENCQSLLEIGLKNNENRCDIFDTIDDVPETPKSVEIIDLTTPKKTSQNRSPLLPTQPPSTTCSALTKRRSRVCCNGTLDSWINWFEPPPKRKPVNGDKYDRWLNITPDVSPEKLDLEIKTNKQYTKNAKIAVNGSCSAHVLSESLTSSTGIRPTFPNRNSGKVRRLTPSNAECPNENIREFQQISPRISSRSITNQKSQGITELQNSSVMLKSTLPIISTSQEEADEDQLDVISSLSDDFTLPLTPSPPNTLQKSETLKQMSLATVLNRSNVAEYYALLESRHTRSLMKAISSPTFSRNDRKYVDNELTSRFDDDGKVRRKKVERRLLHGFDCRCCADYYEALGLNQDERNKRIDQVSKHRNTEREPSTPEYYWEIGMPNIEEQRRRGQIVESNSPIALKTRYPEYKPKRRARRRLFT